MKWSNSHHRSQLADHVTQQQATLQGKVKGQIPEVSLRLCSLLTGSDRQAEG